MGYYLALDAGGTKTDCALADETRILARVTTGSIKRMRVTVDEATANLVSALERLSALSGIGLHAVAATCVGTSGYSIPLVSEWIRKTLSPLVGGRLVICGDEEIALDAAFRKGRGVVVIAGTGSNVGGRALGGEIVHAGGWGPAFSDEGSGNWLGQQSLRFAFRAVNERRPAPLLESIAKHWGLASRMELVAYANQIPAPDFAALTPVIVQCAETGDAVAVETLRSGGDELAKLALDVIGHIKELEGASGQRARASAAEATTGKEPRAQQGASFELPEVAFTGSVLQQIGIVRAAMITSLERAHPAIRVRSEAVHPLDGAVWCARNAAK